MKISIGCLNGDCLDCPDSRNPGAGICGCPCHTMREAKRIPPHPLQPLVQIDDVIRFKGNKIIQWLFDTGRLNLNLIAVQGFPAEDHQQLAQLLGYSLSGYGDLSYVDHEAYERASAQPIEEENKSNG